MFGLLVTDGRGRLLVRRCMVLDSPLLCQCRNYATADFISVCMLIFSTAFNLAVSSQLRSA